MYTVSEIQAIIQPICSLVNRQNAPISELCFDSRKVSYPLHTLFFAIKTELNDGHRFIDELVKKGVFNFVVTEPLTTFSDYKNCNFLQVKDAVQAMQRLAVYHRHRFHIPVIGITGSNGKTIVKEWLSQMLANDFSIVKNPNSYNSQIGVPVSVMQMNTAHTLGIFEAGISQKNEMPLLAEMIRPEIGILTNIGDAHARYFASQCEKLEEKLRLFAFSKVLIYCSDQELVNTVLAKSDYNHLQKISWGESENAYYRVTNKILKEHYAELEINSQPLLIPFTDAASIENAIHAAVLMLYLNYPMTIINQRLALLTSVNMRMEIIEAQNQSIIINDTYSLDLNSLRIALDFLASQKQFLKKGLIISDFQQVDTLSENDYSEINLLLKQHNIGKLIAVGPEFYLNQSRFDIPEQFFYRTTDELMENIRETEMQNEAVLVKGARNFHFERVVDLLQMKTHQTILSVNLSAIINNLNYHRSLIKPGTKIVAMVKALCYGLGDAELISELCYHNIDYLAVAYADEGVSLRKKNIKTPIIVLGAEAHSFEMMLAYDLEPEIYNFHYLHLLEKTLSLHPEIASFNIHIKLDTGMHRLGFDLEDIDELITRLKANPKLKVASVFSHLAAAEDEKEDEYTRAQIRAFEAASAKIIQELGYPVLRHILNSAGIIRFPEAQFEMVRVGLGLYGFTSIPSAEHHFQNSVTLKTLITQVKKIKKGETIGYNRTFAAEREMEIAVIPIGYADGYPRALSNGVGEVLVKGKRAPLVGKISMDMSVIDVTGLQAQIGDEVVIYNDEIRVDEVAGKIGAIPYELLTAISKRVQRVYIME